MILHNYFRSSASYRVRIALNLKNLPYEYKAIHLSKNGGQQFSPLFATLNPQKLVPVINDEGTVLSQSLAILEYLDERFPIVPLLPSDPGDRAYVRQVAMHIACDVHPLNNLRVLKFLSGPLKLSEDQRQAWIKHWIELGLEGLEADISKSGKAGRFCFGDAPTMADCCLVPQLASAQRFDVNIARYPMLKDIHDACEQLAAFRHAHPSKQPDAE